MKRFKTIFSPKKLSLIIIVLGLFPSRFYGQCTVGNNSPLSSNSTHVENFLLGSAIVITNNFSLTSLGMIAATAGDNFKVGVYSNAGGNPGNLLTEGAGTTVAGVNVIQVPDVVLTPGTYYYMAVFETQASISYTLASSDTVWYKAQNFSSNLPTSFGAPTVYSGSEFSYYFIGVNAGTDTRTECNSYTWIDGNTYTTSNNTATYTIVGGASSGCDSLVILDLTISNPVMGTDTRTECNSYMWIDGNTYTSSNNSATHTLTNAAGCDSIVTLNLTINNSTTGTDLQEACDSYTWIDGITYTSSTNSATFTLTNAAGCDSVVTLNLTIFGFPTAIITDNGDGTAIGSGGTSFEWYNCDEETTILGETSADFVVPADGNYAVIVANANGCKDTSDCVLIDFIGIGKHQMINISVCPNPANDFVTIVVDAPIADLIITDAQGKQVDTMTMKSTSTIDLRGYKAGVYFFNIRTSSGEVLKRVTKL